MPLGAFIADKKIMDCLTNNPVLGHINTFGGHPVCCAAGLAAFEVLHENNLVEKVFGKENMFLSTLSGISGIKKIRSRGLMISLQFESFEQNKKVIDELLKEGVFTDWFLFAPECLRIVPPLIITEDEIAASSEAIKKVVSGLK